MTTRAERPCAREACPTTTRRMIAEGAQRVDVREWSEVAQPAVDMPGMLRMPLPELAQRSAARSRNRELVLVCESGARSAAAADPSVVGHGIKQAGPTWSTTSAACRRRARAWCRRQPGVQLGHPACEA